MKMKFKIIVAIHQFLASDGKTYEKLKFSWFL